MKKYFLSSILFATLLFANTTTNAQAFETGDNVISVGLGLGTALGTYNGATHTPAISLQYEHGQWTVGGPGCISLGGYLGYQSSNYKSAGYEQSWRYTVIGVKSAYHYLGIDSKKLDVYGGLLLSYNILSYSNNYPSTYNFGSYGSAVGLTVYLGGRYYFTDNIAAFAELGWGISYLTVGAAFKF